MRHVASVLVACCVLSAPLAGQQDAQKNAVAVREAAARNQKALAGYGWIEKVELRLKGEVKSTKVSQCRYGPDGKVLKTPIVEPPPPQKRGGVRGRVVERKVGDMKEDLEAAVALVHECVPPSGERIGKVADAGGISAAQAGPGLVTLRFAGYRKPGDTLALTFEAAAQSLRRMQVATWLDDPKAPVSLAVTMAALPDKTDYPAKIVLALPARQIEVTILNSNHQKLAQ